MTMETTRARTRATQVLTDAGLSGSLLARDLDTGHEIGINEDTPYALASLVKLPLVGAVLDRFQSRDLDPTQPLHLDPANRTPGPSGLSLFRYPATVAVGDLPYLTMAVSDNTAADALFALVAPPAVDRWVDSLGVRGIRVRHSIRSLYQSIAERVEGADLAVLHRLVVAADRTGAPSPIPQLDPDAANAGTARAFADLLTRIWGSEHDRVGALRDLMGANLVRHRLAPDFSSDRTRWFSRTGSFLNLRHEVGVVEHTSGRRIAVCALTRSAVAASDQPAAEAAIGRAARILHDHILDSAT